MSYSDGADHIPDTREITVPGETKMGVNDGAPNHGWDSPIDDPNSDLSGSSSDDDDEDEDDDERRSRIPMLASRIPEGTYLVPSSTTIIILKRDRDGDFSACMPVVTADELEGTFSSRFERFVEDAPDCGDDHWVVLQDGSDVFFLVRVSDIVVWPG